MSKQRLNPIYSSKEGGWFDSTTDTLVGPVDVNWVGSNPPAWMHIVARLHTGQLTLNEALGEVTQNAAITPIDHPF